MKLQVGAGALTRQVEVLTEREAQLGTLEDLANDRAAKVAKLQRLRRDIFEEFEGERAERFESRIRIANRLKDDLGPEIKADVIESGMTNSYANIIAAALRGSGLSLQHPGARSSQPACLRLNWSRQWNPTVCRQLQRQ